ncbi:ribosomal RNA small subunit methyltransferase G 1 [Bdellovibrio bacteriovorus]|uniref:Ribosomal RNA small subunit methyltransferase G n=1 Tax=Bdellovibrio bacteriovorus TaxID=959 RepID=A0A161PR39_BDEBC|nr:RsmG family class I SAM-dependent methyltransferase [Bdellovibrio bacteriovorus]KYG69213.1 ribosomal RNA small subunit methyltransferase G 1 [Bdellovibrio bacteriovorus]
MYFESRIPIILQLGFREEALPLLKAYIDLLWSSNEELNLISRKMTFEELIDNHIIDCLLPLKYFPANLKAAADFGSGGGLPAVIYAIQFPQMRYHLYEKSPKKQEFLAKCKSIAPNLEIHGEIPKDLAAIEMVTARGFKPIDVILDVSRTYFNKQGRYFLLKARREKIDEEMALALKKFKNAKATITPLTSPVLEVERNLVQL